MRITVTANDLRVGDLILSGQLAPSTVVELGLAHFVTMTPSGVRISELVGYQTYAIQRLTIQDLMRELAEVIKECE